jgi:hypothetical protein
VPDESGRSRGRAAVLAWGIAAAVLVVNGATMLSFAGGVDDSVRPAVVGLGIVVLLLGGLAGWRARHLFRQPPR